MPDRQVNATNVIRLALMLAASAEGLTLDEIARALAVSRSTAERMRNAVREIFPLDEVSEPPTKRFRIPSGLDGFVQTPSVSELRALEAAQRHAEAAGRTDESDALRTLTLKVLSATRAQARNRLAPDVEALMRAEAIAVRQGPRPLDRPEVLKALREALLQQRQIRFRYVRDSSPGTERVVIPFGLVVGDMPYLVARTLTHDKPVIWRLDRMQDVTILDEFGAPPEGFDLQAYADRSFGIFQEEPVEVCIRILPKRAADARRHEFHPSQRLTDEPDGSVLVHMRGGGLLSLAWELVKWAPNVEIVAPDALAAAIARIAADLASLDRRRPAGPSDP